MRQKLASLKPAFFLYRTLHRMKCLLSLNIVIYKLWFLQTTVVVCHHLLLLNRLTFWGLNERKKAQTTLLAPIKAHPLKCLSFSPARSLHCFRGDAGWWRQSLGCTRPWWCWSTSQATRGCGTWTTLPCSWTKWDLRTRRCVFVLIHSQSAVGTVKRLASAILNHVT